MVDKQTPILVVGAGVTGLALACVLKRAGAAVRIIDKLPERLPFARAVAVHSRTLEVFQDLGFVDRILERGQKVGASSVYSGARQLHRVCYDAFEAPYPFQLNLEQWKTEELLEECLGDLTVERNTELVTAEERLDGVRVTLLSPDGSREIVDTPWMVGCDGAHSKVRHLNRQHFPGEQDVHQFLVADIVLDHPPSSDEHCTYLSEAGVLSWHRLPDGRAYLLGSLAELHDGHAETPILSDVQEVLDRNGPGGLIAKDPRWMSWYRPHYRLTPHYRHGRTFLAGDAAHIQSSFGGLGMNTGIQDAYNLGWKLALVSQGQAPESLLDSYEKERRAIAQDMLTLSRQLADNAMGFGSRNVATNDNPSLHGHLPEMNRSKEVRRMAALDLDYRKSPICAERVASGSQVSTTGPHAGSEAVNVERLRVGGRTVSLFELIAGPHHTLLLFVGHTEQSGRLARVRELAAQVDQVYGDRIRVCLVFPSGPAIGGFSESNVAIVVDDGALHNRYGASAGGLYLIRPDGHVGFRSSSVSLTALRDHFENVFRI